MGRLRRGVELYFTSYVPEAGRVLKRDVLRREMIEIADHGDQMLE